MWAQPIRVRVTSSALAVLWGGGIGPQAATKTWKYRGNRHRKAGDGDLEDRVCVINGLDIEGQLVSLAQREHHGRSTSGGV